MIRLIGLVCLALLGVGAAPQAQSHALDPGYVDLRPVAGDAIRVVWRVPDVQGQPMEISLRLPETCTAVTPPALRQDGRAWGATWVTECPGGLAGGTIEIEGLDATGTDVLVRYVVDGQARASRLTPDAPRLTIPAVPGAFDVLTSYFPLGMDHILEGIDHLLFVLALLLLIPDRWRLLGAITAFTVAHSLTMAAATLGWLTLPGPPVEAVIALSIMFVASELVQRRPGAERLSERFPWTVSFSFGLLHGFGFAGALRDIGLPETDVPLALFAFNLGVEAGQLAFVAVLLAMGWALRRIWAGASTAFAPGATAAVVTAYAIGGVSAYWFIDRVAGF